MMLFDLDESPEPPPSPPPFCRAGVEVIVAKPVVLETTVAEVEVFEETTPFSVTTIVSTSCDVELPSKALVMVVFEVLLVDFEEVLEVLSDVGVVGVDVGVVITEVDSLVEVDVLVMVVGVSFEVVVKVDVEVEDDVVTDVLDAAAGDESLEEDTEAPVPAACRLWKMPSMIGFPVACTVATIAINENVSLAEKCIAKVSSRPDSSGSAVKGLQ